MVEVSDLLGGNLYTFPMDPPITLVALDHQPGDGRSNTHLYQRNLRVRGLSTSTGGPWDLTRAVHLALGLGSSYRGSRGWGGHR